MSYHDQIIDVTPVNHSSSRIDEGHAGAPRSSSQSRPPAGTADAADVQRPSILGGVAQMALGAGLVAIGVPMLILPGPGLLSIGAGVMLAGRGFSKVVGRA